MSIKFGRNEKQYAQLAKVWKVEDKGTYAVVNFGTSRKDKKTDSYKNSSWGFARFVGSAYEGITNVPLKSTIEIISGTLDMEPYEKDGETVYPKQPHITVFAWKVYERDEDGGNNDTQNKESVEEEYPF